MTTSAIRISSTNPLDPGKKAIDDLAHEVRLSLPELAVEVEHGESGGHRVSLWEVVTVNVPWDVLANIGNVAALVASAAIWLKNRHKRDAGARERRVDIYGPDGKVVKSIRLPRGSDEIKTLDGSNGM